MLIEPFQELFDEQPILLDAISITTVLALSIIVYFISKRLAPRALESLKHRTKTEADEIIFENVVMRRLLYILPFFVINTLAFVFNSFEETILRLTGAMMSFILLLTVGALLDVTNRIYMGEEIAGKIPIKSHLELIKIFVYVVGTITIFGQLTGRSPWYFITGVGVFTAILLMIFKDTILSFVAGLQIATHDLFREGDWIEVPSYDADGDVIDISLHSIRIQNWDKTITVIPTYKFLEISFRNWRGMQESGGRRIKRSIHIDVSSIRLCDREMIERFKNIRLIRDYMLGKEKEVREYNAIHNLDSSEIVNERNLTNVGTFRAYIKAYLKQHPKIHRELTFLVRQLPSGPDGLPIQIYVFTNDTNWVNYEEIQADIFDHLLAVAKEFELRIFQNLAGSDFGKLNIPISEKNG